MTRCPYGWHDCVVHRNWLCVKPAGHKGRHRLRRVTSLAVAGVDRTSLYAFASNSTPRV